MKKQATAINRRIQASKAAIGSVRAEGLKPSVATRTHLKDYSAGKITSSQLHKLVQGEVKSIIARASS